MMRDEPELARQITPHGALDRNGADVGKTCIAGTAAVVAEEGSAAVTAVMPGEASAAVTVAVVTTAQARPASPPLNHPLPLTITAPVTRTAIGQAPAPQARCRTSWSASRLGAAPGGMP
jgi:hypothetical protein